MEIILLGLILLIYLLTLGVIVLGMYFFSKAYFKKSISIFVHGLILVQHPVLSIILYFTRLRDDWSSFDLSWFLGLTVLMLPGAVYIYRKKGLKPWQALILLVIFAVAYALVSEGGWNVAEWLHSPSPGA